MLAAELNPGTSAPDPPPVGLLAGLGVAGANGCVVIVADVGFELPPVSQLHALCKLPPVLVCNVPHGPSEPASVHGASVECQVTACAGTGDAAQRRSTKRGTRYLVREIMRTFYHPTDKTNRSSAYSISKPARRAS